MISKEVGYDAGKQIHGRKRHLTVDLLGLVLRVLVTSASVPEVNLSHHLLGDFRLCNPNCGIADLKAYCRGFQYAHETIKMLPQKPEPILLAKIFHKLTCLGRIYSTQPYSPAS